LDNARLSQELEKRQHLIAVQLKLVNSLQTEVERAKAEAKKLREDYETRMTKVRRGRHSLF